MTSRNFSSKLRRAARLAPGRIGESMYGAADELERLQKLVDSHREALRKIYQYPHGAKHDKDIAHKELEGNQDDGYTDN